MAQDSERMTVGWRLLRIMIKCREKRGFLNIVK